LLDVLQEDCLVWKWESHRHYTVRHDIECWCKRKKNYEVVV
jgi:hypothetical protein